MLISYNWLKWYVPDLVEAEKLADIFNYHICEVENVEKKADDYIFDINVLPNRAHDLLSHQGVARELASLLNIKFVDPTPKYKIPPPRQSSAGQTELKIDIQSDKCRRYMGRIVRSVKIGPSPEWVVKHLESIGQRSINNMVDAANIVMFNCGQPTHIFDLNKTKEKLVIRQAKDGETLTTLDNKECEFRTSDLVIADLQNILAVAGIKGGKVAEVDANTKDIILEVANFDPTSVRKTAQALNIFTDARKRFENDLSPELTSYAMRELSATILEMCPDATFEDIVDTYPQKQKERKLSFSVKRISKILGLEVSESEIDDILRRYNFRPHPLPPLAKGRAGERCIIVPPLRLDLVIEEDMAEEVGRILGYDKVQPIISKIKFAPKQNETYAKILWARNKLLSDGYSEVMTYVFRDKGEVEVEKSASDKKFLRTNLADGLKESLKLNTLNAPLLGLKEIKIFEIGTVFSKKGEEINVAYNEKEKIIEMKLEEFNPSPALPEGEGATSPLEKAGEEVNKKFQMWSLFPFIVRDVAVWVPDGIKSEEVEKIIKDNVGELVVRGPELFDEFKKGDKTSYAFRLVFQSYERTLTDAEVNEVMDKIASKIKGNTGWEVR